MLTVSQLAFTAEPANRCPDSGSRLPHRVCFRDTADLLDLGISSMDVGVTVALGRCERCGVPLLGIGERIGGGDDLTTLPVLLELPTAFLAEE